MNQKITRIRRKLMAELDKERYEHTLGVMYTAASMAMRYDADIDKALMAGLLHDCADYIEPGREELPNMAEVRKLAFHDIDACLYRILKDSLVYLDSRNIPIDPMTEKSYQYYKDKLDQKEE